MLKNPYKNFGKLIVIYLIKLDLRPIKILMRTPDDERNQSDSKYDKIAEEISEHYRIPILKVRDIIKEISETV